MKNCVHTAYIS